MGRKIWRDLLPCFQQSREFRYRRYYGCFPECVIGGIRSLTLTADIIYNHKFIRNCHGTLRPYRLKSWAGNPADGNNNIHCQLADQTFAVLCDMKTGENALMLFPNFIKAFAMGMCCSPVWDWSLFLSNLSWSRAWFGSKEYNEKHHGMPIPNPSYMGPWVEPCPVTLTKPNLGS